MMRKLVIAIALLIAPCAEAQWSTGTQAPSTCGPTNCTLTGTLTAPTINVTTATGYQQYGGTVLTSQIGTGFTGVGTNACGAMTASALTGSEDLCAGNGAGQNLGTGAIAGQAAHDTYVGAFSGGYEKVGNFNAVFGNDAQRNATSITGAAYLGDYVGSSYFGYNGVAAGNQTLRGNSSAVTIGSPASGDIVNLTITASSLTGSPITISSSALTGASTPASVVADLSAKLVANSNIFNDNIIPASNTTVPGLAGVLAINHQGTNSIGDTFTVTTSITGAGPRTTTATVTYGSNASNGLLALGPNAMDGIALTTAASDGCGGQWCLSSLTTGSNDWAWGTQSLWNVTTASNIWAAGPLAGQNLTTSGNCAFAGANAFQLSNANGCGSGIGYHIGLNVTVGAPDLVGNSTGDFLNNASATVIVGSQSGEGASVSASTNSLQSSSIVGFRNFQNVTAGNRIDALGTFLEGACTTCSDQIIAGYNLWNNLTNGFDDVVLGFGGNGSNVNAPGTGTSQAFYLYLGTTSPAMSITGGGTPTTEVATLPGTVNVASLTASLPVCTDGSKNLSSTCPAGNQPILIGTTASIGGGALTPGACAAGTATVTGATSSMAATASPSADPDSTLSTGISIYAFVSSSNTVTVRVCAIVAVTPTAVTYNVRVIQ